MPKDLTNLRVESMYIETVDVLAELENSNLGKGAGPDRPHPAILKN